MSGREGEGEQQGERRGGSVSEKRDGDLRETHLRTWVAVTRALNWRMHAPPSAAILSGRKSAPSGWGSAIGARRTLGDDSRKASICVGGSFVSTALLCSTASSTIATGRWIITSTTATARWIIASDSKMKQLVQRNCATIGLPQLPS